MNTNNITNVIAVNISNVNINKAFNSSKIIMIKEFFG